MTPSLNTYNPNKKAEFQAAYAEGFRAGKKAALREIKYLAKEIKKLEPFSTYTSTVNTHETTN